MNLCKTTLSLAIFAGLSACASNSTHRQTVNLPVAPTRIAQVEIGGHTMFVTCSVDCPRVTTKVIDDGVTEVSVGPSQRPTTNESHGQPIPNVLPLKPVPTDIPEAMTITPEQPKENTPQRKTSDSLIYGEVLRQLNAKPPEFPTNREKPAGEPGTEEKEKKDEIITSPAPLGSTERPSDHGAPTNDAPAVQPVQSPASEKDSNSERENGHPVTTLHFNFDSSELTPDARDMVRQIAVNVNATSMPVQIVGFTSAEGLPVYNQYLAMQRAVKVSQALRAEGVKPSQIQTTARANCCYVSGNANEEERQLNRRVEISVAGVEEKNGLSRTSAPNQVAGIR
jgi:peptidoglycan-associated lipoprotein